MVGVVRGVESREEFGGSFDAGNQEFSGAGAE